MAILNGDHPTTGRNGPLTVGVTGGIGSGKSVVCDILERRGARVFDADEVGKRILVEDSVARDAITREFGGDSYHADGSLNRRHLAEIVFNDTERLEVINSIVHPRVFAAFEHVRERSATDGTRLLIHEAALLFEAGGDRLVDCSVYVDAPRWLRVQRVRDRDGKSRAEVLSRMRHQLPAYKGRKRADYVIQNDDTLTKLETRVDRLISKLEQRFKRRLR